MPLDGAAHRFADLKPKPKKARNPWQKSRKLQEQYARQLRKIAREVGRIVDGYPPGDPAALPHIEVTLQRYADILDPWARLTAEKLWQEINHQDFAAWAKHSQEMERALASEVRFAPTGQVFKAYMDQQVALIRSIPIKAARRVHELTIRGLEDAERAGDVAEEIMRTTHVTESRAMLIARTEVSRTSTNLVQARSEFVGSDGYIWRTSRDGTVRPEHKKLEGKFIRWDTPPVAGTKGMRYHAGAGPNCRCWPEPVIADIIP